MDNRSLSPLLYSRILATKTPRIYRPLAGLFTLPGTGLALAWHLFHLTSTSFFVPLRVSSRLKKGICENLCNLWTPSSLCVFVSWWPNFIAVGHEAVGLARRPMKKRGNHRFRRFRRFFYNLCNRCNRWFIFMAGADSKSAPAKFLIFILDVQYHRDWDVQV